MMFFFDFTALRDKVPCGLSDDTVRVRSLPLSVDYIKYAPFI